MLNFAIECDVKHLFYFRELISFMMEETEKSKQIITEEQLLRIMPNSKLPWRTGDASSPSKASVYVLHLNKFMREYGITEPLAVAYFLATIAVESGELRYTEELASGEAYEGRKDLGNTKPGYGKRYKGRGLIQITGYFNYRAYSLDMHYDFYSTDARAKGLAQAGNATRSACWFWQKHNLSVLSLLDDPQKIRKKVNGGLNGYKAFLGYLLKAKQQLGLPTVSTEQAIKNWKGK